MRCPLSSDKWGALASCSYENCALSDEAGNCLIKQALQLYVSQERTKIAEKEAAERHFETIAKNGFRKPLTFIKESE